MEEIDKKPDIATSILNSILKLTLYLSIGFTFLVVFVIVVSILLGGMMYSNRGGKAQGVVVKINDGTADYGLVGTYTPNGSGEKKTGKFRLSKNNYFNRAKYEGKEVKIKECEIYFLSPEEEQGEWREVLYDYISQ